MQSLPLDQLKQAAKANPRNPATHYELGNALLKNGQAAEALNSYRTALKLAPGHPQILLQLGNAQAALGHYQEAALQFQATLRADPVQPGAHYNLGNALREMGLAEQAAASYRAALQLTPQDADIHNNLGNVLRELGRLDEAIACYQQALSLNPRLHHARMHLLHQRMHCCDWTGLETEVAEIRRLVREEPEAQISPFAFLALPGTTAEEQRRCAENWAHTRLAPLAHQSLGSVQSVAKHPDGKLRIGYLSADFRQHPLTSLAAEVIELHDRDRFVVYGYSYGPDDRTSERLRWSRAFDHFRDIRPVSMQAAAQRMRDDRIDILVDLTGYTQNSRTGILAMRPAPLQINWLGFPGTLGAPFADYLIADAYIAPQSQADCYSEALLRLPCYQPNDRQRPAAAVPNRAECGLPENALVLCSFNQTFKITPQVFDIWMKVVGENSDSVLWLLECNRWAKANLQREAQVRGIDPARLIFAPRVAMAEHLARHRCADLFLDTLPYNAHTSASDALWMGLPVLTCAGTTFASRVAGSLLHAIGTEDMVTESLADYEAKAKALVRDRQALAALRTRLDSVRTSSLFDTPAFTRRLEQAYQHIWQRRTEGRPPQSLDVS